MRWAVPMQRVDDWAKIQEPWLNALWYTEPTLLFSVMDLPDESSSYRCSASPRETRHIADYRSPPPAVQKNVTSVISPFEKTMAIKFEPVDSVREKATATPP